jgi:hypothetical protein
VGHWKGSSGELEVAKLLGPWWSQVEPGTIFTRSPGSGGWAKRRVVPPGFKGHGDLLVDPTVTKLYPFSVEVKWRKTVKESSVIRFCTGQDSPVWGFWEQCVRDAVLNDLAPMLWFRGANVGVVGKGKGTRMPWRVVYANRKSISYESIHIKIFSDFLKLDPKTFL